MIINQENNYKVDYNLINEKVSWNVEKREELRMHKIHVYPAKFPSFLVNKSLEYARRNGVEVKSMGDVFCGCGTSALEAKKNNIHFWGCDINPVATLITKVKTNKYNETELKRIYNKIIELYSICRYTTPKYIANHERINFWFEKNQIEKLYCLKRIILKTTPKGKYQDFFLVAFSNILKGASRWLTKSIKPTIDKKKPIKDIAKLFRMQFNLMFKAVKEYNVRVQHNSKTKIITSNFLGLKRNSPFLDLLITSPPYVTSYEYADLHQLSTLWLGFAKDYRVFRTGTIGSKHHHVVSDEEVSLKVNPIGLEIYKKLLKTKRTKAKSVAKYFIDMNASVNKSYSIINPGGLAVYVIGNTTFKGVYIDNAKYLTQCMYERGFQEVRAYRRKISSKILSPFRNKDGKFSGDKRKRKVYSYEFVLLAKK